MNQIKGMATPWSHGSQTMPQNYLAYLQNTDALVLRPNSQVSAF